MRPGGAGCGASSGAWWGSWCWYCWPWRARWPGSPRPRVSGGSWPRPCTIANEQLSGKLEAGSVDLSAQRAHPAGREALHARGRAGGRGGAGGRAPLAGAPGGAAGGAHLRAPGAPAPVPGAGRAGPEPPARLEPKQPKPEEPDTGRGSLRLTLEDFKLEDGYVDFTSDTERGHPQQVRLEDFDASGGASYGAAKQAFDARLEATGGLSRPAHRAR